jgi:hypothetical protein
MQRATHPGLVAVIDATLPRTRDPPKSPCASHSLDASALVFSKFYMAVQVISVRRATWREVSEARSLFKDPDDEFIRTVYIETQVPRVIRLLAFDRSPRQKVKFNRRNIFALDSNHCQYCGRRFVTSDLSLDHVQPRSSSGRRRTCDRLPP